MAERRPDPTTQSKKTYTKKQFEGFYGAEAGAKMWKKGGKLLAAAGGGGGGGDRRVDSTDPGSKKTYTKAQFVEFYGKKRGLQVWEQGKPRASKAKGGKPSPKVVLKYFDIPGAAEKVRLALVLAGVPFDDVRVSRDEWQAMKPTTPYGQLPVMSIGKGKEFAQSGAMLRWAGTQGDGSLYPAAKMRLVEEVIGISDDLARALTPCLYISMRPETYGYTDLTPEKKGELTKSLRTKFAAEKLPEMLGYYARLLEKNKFLCGNAPTIADCTVLPQLRWLSGGVMDHIPTTCLDASPKLKEWIDRMLALAAVKAWYAKKAAEKSDTQVTVVPYFTVPEGKMDEFKAGFKDFYKSTKKGTKECLYYGFCVNEEERKVFCREGYRSAAGVLAHLGDVKAPLDKAVGMVGEGGLDLAIMGPAAELAKLKEPLGPLGAKFYETDKVGAGGKWFRRGAGPGKPDKHVTIVPYFKVPEGKMDDFTAGFKDFYKATKEGTKECLYYNFAIEGNTVFCREGYKSADGVLAHLGDVKAPLDKAVEMVGPGGLSLAVMGPAAELEKLKGPMGPLGTKWYVTDAGAFWR